MKRAAPRRRRWPGRVAALGFAVLLLGGTEFALRRAGFGGFPPLVREIGEVGGRRLFEVEAVAMQSYFATHRAGRGSGRQSSFYEPKSPDTIRIVLAGESALLGYPQPPPLSAASFLAWSLERCWPGRTVELINLSTTAVASFPVADMTRQLLDHQPDLVIVYAGNNEFYGAFGVASSHFAARSPAWMAWQRRLLGTATAQALARVMQPRTAPDHTLMERMIGEATIPPDSPLRARAADHLAHHVGAIAAACRARNIPVIVCTLAANERDLAPFGASAEPGRNARAAFDEARTRLAAGDRAGAAERFGLAIDLDTMPWRPTSLQQAALRRTATAHGALLCDVAAQFRAASDDGLIGWETMDDHVHFSLRGQHLLALSLLRTMAALPGRLNVPPDAVFALPSWDKAAARLGRNVYDAYASAQALQQLFDTPFMQTSNPGASSRNRQRLRELAGQMDPAIAPVFRQVIEQRGSGEAAALPASGIAAEMLITAGRETAALPLLDVAARSLPEYASMRRLYAALALAIQRRAAGGTLDAAALATARREIERGEALLTFGADPSGTTEFALAQLYTMTGDRERAAARRAAALARNPVLAEAWPWPEEP